MAVKFTYYDGQIIYIYIYSNYTTSHKCGTHPVTRMKGMLHVLIILVSCYQYQAISIGLRSQLHSSFFKKFECLTF